MAPIVIEIVGLKDSTCSPFPCDMTRSCGLYDCHPTGMLVPAFEALKKELHQQYGDAVRLTLVLIDTEIPDHLQAIIKEKYPPLPFVVIDGSLVPMGRISLPLMQKEIEKRMGDLRRPS
ncbi:MAG: hypothetical protein NQU46_04265 [Methanolinea sp.]|nr:hypothetical protein [Methanolinea sp.]